MSILYDELTKGPLAEELAPLILSRMDLQIYNIMNRKDILIYGKLLVHDVKQYISLLGLRIPILDSTASSCREFNLALDDFKESGFDLANQYIFAKIVQVLDSLVAEPLIPDFTEENKLFILSIGQKLVSRADIIGGASLNQISDALNLGV
ncbi:MAG: hypothetical protein PHG08_00390 [Bacilli bacterium]|nr:hypothetical protein [Bacilli bacterium]